MAYANTQKSNVAERFQMACREIARKNPATGAIHLTHGRVVCRDQPNPIPVSDVQSGCKKGSASPRSENRDNEPENPSSRKARP